MADITIKMKDGTTREFKEEARLGGSYCNSLSFDIGFVTVKDVWDRKTSLPSEDIKEIIQHSHHSRW